MHSTIRKYISFVLLLLLGVLIMPTELLHGFFGAHEHETADTHFDCHAHHIEEKHNHCPTLDFTSPAYTNADEVGLPKLAEAFQNVLFVYIDKGFSNSIYTCFLRGPPIV